MQKKITQKGPLLDSRGHLTQTGYANELILDYQRRAIKANPLRIKEWDYYLINDGEKAFALTIDDNSYMGLASVSLLDLKAPWQITASSMRLLPLGRTGFPSTSVKGDVHFADKRVKLSFLNDGIRRCLSCEMKDFTPGKDLKAEILLTDPPHDTMVIATPFKEDKKAFYYNQKINCLRAEGRVTYDGKELVFHKDSAFAVLDWGRGVWTYSNTWYWGTGSGQVDGAPFGFNIGYGFGDTSAASENMLFYDGSASKLDQVVFHIPQRPDGSEDYMSPWHFSSNDGRFEVDFNPVIDRAADEHVLFISSDQHQVFGLCNGRVVLDDGREIILKDFPAAAEKVKNKW